MAWTVAIPVAWLTVGAVVGVVEARHGGWHRGWVVAAIFGPLAIPLALQRRRQARPRPAVLTSGRARQGPVDLLIGIDGSPGSIAAASLAVRLFGPRVRRVMLATALDLDTAMPHREGGLYPEPWPEEEAARTHLDSAAAALQHECEVTPGSVVLAGEPADALEQYAISEGYEVIVVGCRGTGLSKRVLGSCASKLARKTAVPVLLIPADPAPHLRKIASSTVSDIA